MYNKKNRSRSRPKITIGQCQMYTIRKTGAGAHQKLSNNAAIILTDLYTAVHTCILWYIEDFYNMMTLKGQCHEKSCSAEALV